jgi:hypothetical protein
MSWQICRKRLLSPPQLWLSQSLFFQFPTTQQLSDNKPIKFARHLSKRIQHLEVDQKEEDLFQENDNL